MILRSTIVLWCVCALSLSTMLSSLPPVDGRPQTKMPVSEGYELDYPETWGYGTTPPSILPPPPQCMGHADGAECNAAGCWWLPTASCGNKGCGRLPGITGRLFNSTVVVSPWTYTPAYQTTPPNSNIPYHWWVDINGDGLVDECSLISRIPVYCPTGNKAYLFSSTAANPGQAMSCFINMGGAFSEQPLISGVLPYTSLQAPTYRSWWIDFDGDGRQDYCYRVGNKGSFTGSPYIVRTECYLSIA